MSWGEECNSSSISVPILYTILRQVVGSESSYVPVYLKSTGNTPACAGSGGCFLHLDKEPPTSGTVTRLWQFHDSICSELLVAGA